MIALCSSSFKRHWLPLDAGYSSDGPWHRLRKHDGQIHVPVPSANFRFGYHHLWDLLREIRVTVHLGDHVHLIAWLHYGDDRTDSVAKKVRDSGNGS